ncbi:MAG: hypothetical protein IIB28_08225, partial [Chloroflexi bacterium]|nr:hypothetical protein [Chloroflexota bacterium]
SLFTSEGASLNDGGNLENHAEDYPNNDPEIPEGSVITFHVTTTSSAEDITCSLEMDTLSDENEDESE